MARKFNLEIRKEILSVMNLDKNSQYQLRRAALSVMLNIAEGTSRFTNPAKRNFYVIARGSLIECVAILDLLNEETTIHSDLFIKYYSKAEELSKILFSLIRSLESKKENSN